MVGYLALERGICDGGVFVTVGYFLGRVFVMVGYVALAQGICDGGVFVMVGYFFGQGIRDC